MDVHCKIKLGLGTLAMALFSLYPMWLFGYKNITCIFTIYIYGPC